MHDAYIDKFALGHNNIIPDNDCISKAKRIVDFVDIYMYNCTVEFQDEDGLEIHGRTTNGYLLMANLFFDGSIDASIYNDIVAPVKTVTRIRRNDSNETEQQLINAMKI